FRKEGAFTPPAVSHRATVQSHWMDAIVAPSGANAKARIGAYPTPRIRLAGLACRGGPEIGSQGRAMSPRSSRPSHLGLHQGNREIPIRDRLGPSSADPEINSPSVASHRIVNLPFAKPVESVAMARGAHRDRPSTTTVLVDLASLLSTRADPARLIGRT